MQSRGLGPQTGILRFVAMADRVVAVDGQVAIKPMMTITLSDHPIVDAPQRPHF